MPKQSVELLAPAGNESRLSITLNYGADAVYFGANDFGLRSVARGFDEESLARAIERVQRAGRRCYVVLNIFAHNRDLVPLREHLQSLARNAPDGVIVSDPGVFDLVSQVAPSTPIHISTQAGAARFWQRLGATRIVLARELSLREIHEIRDSCDLELEAFVHGAMCMAYSGRCFLSAAMTGRSANAGECTNSCRWNYRLIEENRLESPFPIEQDGRGSYILSARDLCMLGHLKELRAAGVSCFKIEGRNRGLEYLAVVLSAYRQTLDSNHAEPTIAGWVAELERLSSHGLSTGFYFDGTPQYPPHARTGQPALRGATRFAGVTEDRDGAIGIVTLQRLSVTDQIEVLSSRRYSFFACSVRSLTDRCEIGAGDWLDLSPVPGIRAGELVRLQLATPEERGQATLARPVGTP